jgi:predicted nuclease of predicted toxin-antitoxin system
VTIWLDNHLPPVLVPWMTSTLSVECIAVRTLNLQRASDTVIFMAARAAGCVVFTKDEDFVRLVGERAPTQIVLVTCGNTSNARLRQIVAAAWPAVLPMLERGEPLVELGEQP